MDQVYQNLSQRAIDLLKQNDSYRILILIAGSPGSGKSTIASKVCEILNNEYSLNKFYNDSGNAFQNYADDTTDAKFSNNLDNYCTSAVVKQLDTQTLSEDALNVDAEDESYEPKIVYKTNSEVCISGRSLENAVKLCLPSDDDCEESENTFAQVIPMDGFHLPMSCLEQFKDPELAISKRGSPYTFDSAMVVKLIELIKSTCDVVLTETEEIILSDSSENSSTLSSSLNSSAKSSLFEMDLGSMEQFGSDDSDDYFMQKLKSQSMWYTKSGRETMIPDIYLPNFDHALKDPSKFGTKISSSSRIVIMEGLYLLLNMGNWANIRQLTDDTNCETWRVCVDEKTARERIAKRHLESGLVSSIAEGENKYDFNDRQNGTLVMNHSFKACLDVDSVNEH